jgi:two-component system chemotaxis response regulator CheY
VCTRLPSHGDFLNNGNVPALGCRILVVEDDADLREMMAQLLELEGFDPMVAADGQDAWEQLHTSSPPPHVIVLDMMMPRMDGWTFRAQQESDPAIRDIPVVVLSAAPREQLNAVSAAAILDKPFNYDRLLAAVRANC